MREDGTIKADQKPSDDELQRYNKKRKKPLSNDDWVSKTDPDARITKMKDGRTHLAYKAEHVVDVDSEILQAAGMRPADHADQHTLVDSVIEAKINLEAAGRARGRAQPTEQNRATFRSGHCERTGQLG